MVLTDTRDVGWHAQVNGRSAAIYPIDHLFRGVPLPAGKSLIVMTYRPWTFITGAWVAGAAFAVALASSSHRLAAVADMGPMRWRDAEAVSVAPTQRSSAVAHRRAAC